MNKVQVRQAKANLSALIEAATRGEPTTITRHGKPAAVLVPISDAEKLYPVKRKTLLDHLLAYPDGVELVRDSTPPRSVDL